MVKEHTCVARSHSATVLRDPITAPADLDTMAMEIVVVGLVISSLSHYSIFFSFFFSALLCSPDNFAHEPVKEKPTALALQLLNTVVR